MNFLRKIIFHFPTKKQDNILGKNTILPDRTRKIIFLCNYFWKDDLFRTFEKRKDGFLCSVALKALRKINGKLKFLYRKNRFLTPTLRRVPCDALIQPHFDYTCSALCSNLNKKLRKKKYKLHEISVSIFV